MSENAPIIELHGLSKVFGRGDQRVVAFEDMTLDVRRGEFVCLLGPSGCGKTTLLKCLAGIEKPTGGTLQMNYMPDTGRSDVAMVFQQHGLLPWFTIEGNLRFALRSSPIDPKLHDTIIERFVGRVGLERFRKFYPHQLSGGMNQRISLIRAFAVYPQLMLMDEPFVFLDYQNRIRLQELCLQLWADQKQTIVFVTHNINEAITLGDRVLVLTSSPGKIKTEFTVPFERPRDPYQMRKDPRYNELVVEISEVVREEVEKATHLEENQCLLASVKKGS